MTIRAQRRSIGPAGRRSGQHRYAARRTANRHLPIRAVGNAATAPRIRVVCELDVSYDVVASQLRTNLTSSVLEAAPAGRYWPDLIGLHAHRSGPLRMPAMVEVETAGRVGHMHLRWWARYLARAFPVMEGDLSVRALPNGRSQLVLDGAYLPPLGALGMLGDVLIGQRVARSTAQALLDSLAAIFVRRAHVDTRQLDHRTPQVETKAQTARDHEALLTMARKVRAAAEDRDWARYHDEVARLERELELHLASEAHDLTRVPEAERHRLEVGQAELRGLVDDLASLDAEVPGTSLAISTGRFLAALAYQREQERRALATAV